MKLDPQYYKPGEHHKCMFCSTIIAHKLASGQLASLGNKVHVLLEKQKPGLYIINCCADCCRIIDWKKRRVLNAVHRNVVASKQYCLQLLGKDQKEINRLKTGWDKDKPKVGFLVVETSPVEREKNVSAYMEYLAKQEQA